MGNCKKCKHLLLCGLLAGESKEISADICKMAGGFEQINPMFVEITLQNEVK